MKLSISTLFFFCLFAGCTSIENKSAVAMSIHSEIYSTDCQNWSREIPNSEAYFIKQQNSSEQQIQLNVQGNTSLLVDRNGYFFSMRTNDVLLNYGSDGSLSLRRQSKDDLQLIWALKYIPRENSWVAIGMNKESYPNLFCTKKGCAFSPEAAITNVKLNKENIQVLKKNNIVSKSSLELVEAGLLLLTEPNLNDGLESAKSFFFKRCSVSSPKGYKLSEGAASLKQLSKVIIPTLIKLNQK